MELFHDENGEGCSWESWTLVLEEGDFLGLTSVKLFAGRVGENREGFLKELGTNMVFHKQLTSLKSSQFGEENWNETKLLCVLHLELSGRRKGSRGNEQTRYFSLSMCLLPGRKSVSPC